MIDNNRTTLFLMANLGSEVSQIFSHVDKRKLDLASGPVERARKIIEEIKSREDVKGREAEVRILEEIVDDALDGTSKYAVKQSDVDEYFLPFAMRLMSPK